MADRPRSHHRRTGAGRRTATSRLHPLEKVEEADLVEQTSNIVEFDDAEPPRDREAENGNGEKAFETHHRSPTAQQGKSGTGKPARLRRETAWAAERRPA